jgi:hypothetical protein
VPRKRAAESRRNTRARKPKASAVSKAWKKFPPFFQALEKQPLQRAGRRLFRRDVC